MFGLSILSLTNTSFVVSLITMIKIQILTIIIGFNVALKEKMQQTCREIEQKIERREKLVKELKKTEWEKYKDNELKSLIPNKPK